MQVEGSKNPSNGRLTTSLITPIASAPPPKSSFVNSNIPNPSDVAQALSPTIATPIPLVFLGSQQIGNGQIFHRIGLVVPNDEVFDLEDLTTSHTSSIAHGLVPIIQLNEHTHVYLTSRGQDDETFYTHLIIENRDKGLVACDIAAVNGNQTKGNLQGILTSPLVSPGKSIDPGDPFEIELFLSDLESSKINLGKIERIEIEVGAIERFGPNHESTRPGQELKIYDRSQDTRLDPFSRFPVVTLHQSEISWRFPGFHSGLRLANEIAAGHVFSSQPIQSSGTSISRN